MKINKNGKANMWLIAVAIIVVGLLGYMAYGQYQNTAVPNPNVPSGSSNGNVAVNPTASYSTADKFTSASVSGTAYYKLLGAGVTADANGNIVGGSPYTTTAFTNVNPGLNYAYWVSNGSSEKVAPIVFTATTLNNAVTNTQAYQNSSITLTGYDPLNHATTTSGAYNTTLGANANVNEQLTYQGVSQKSAIPFGGVLAIEFNSTMSSVVCSGQNGGISPGAGNFHVTYTPSALQNKVTLFKIDNTFDNGSGATQTINCQFTNGGSLNANSPWKATIIPAGYYIGNDGNIYLDTEKSMNNGDTTRTNPGALPVFTAYWA